MKTRSDEGNLQAGTRSYWEGSREDLLGGESGLD